jgi:hypothetical protein
MRASQLHKRLESLAATIRPSRIREFTFEELCRLMWRRDKRGFLAMANGEFPVSASVRQFLRTRGCGSCLRTEPNANRKGRFERQGTRMKRALLARLEWLESLPETGKPVFFRYGWFHPDDFSGERHIAIVSREQTRTANVEWCVFEERAGIGPALDRSKGMTVFLTP